MKNIMNINLPRWVEALLTGGFILAMSLAAGCDGKNEGRISKPTEAIELTVTAAGKLPLETYTPTNVLDDTTGAFGVGRHLGSEASARITKPDGTSDFRVFAADLDSPLVVILTALDYDASGVETDVSLPSPATKILLSPGGDFVYLLTASNQILVMNSVTYALDTPIVLQVGSNPVDMDVDSTGRIFVLLAPSTVQIVDPATRKVTTTQNVGSTALSTIAVSPDGSMVALSGPATNQVIFLDGSTLSPSGSVVTGPVNGLAFMPTGKSIFALARFQLMEIDPEANPPQILFEPDIAQSLHEPVPQPSNLRLSIGGNYAYFLDAADSSMRVFDTHSETQTQSVAASGATNIAVVHSYTLKTLPQNLGTAPAWRITATHQGDFQQGQNGAYTITVGNSGNGQATGARVDDTLPPGLTAISFQGTGWTCGLTACSRSDAIAAGASYPPLTLTVNVAANAPASVTNQATVSGGGVLSGVTTTDPTTIRVAKPATWEIMKTHQGTFTQGQNGAVYTITVSNIGDAPTTAGLVQVTETLPTGLTAVSFQGTGWTCTLTGCNRADSLSGEVGVNSYPPLTLTVNVAANAPASVTNQVSVSGGGAVSASASDQATIVAAALPAWTITKTHLGNFTQGQNGATYTITVKNTGAGPTTTGSIAQVTDTLPTGLTAVSIQGTGWICQTPPFIFIGCNRSDSLAAGASYPPITLTVNVAANAPASVTNQVSVSGGGVASGATATDPTTIGAAAPVNVTLTVKTTGAGVGVGLQARIGTSGAYAPTPISQQVLLGQPQTISVLDPQFIAATNGGTGYKFSFWDLTGQPTTPTATLQPGSIDWPATLADPTRNVFTESAFFQVGCYELRVAVSPPGSGTVALSPASGGLPGMPANCYAPGTTVTITPAGNSAQDYVPSLPYPTAGHIVMNAPELITENFVPYAAPQLTIVNLAGAYTGVGANLKATGNLENDTGVNYNNIQITKVMWKLVPTGAAITDTTTLPIAIGNLGTLSGLVTITALFPNTLPASYYACVSGTAVSPLSGKTVTWSDFRYCPLFP
jgi:uncharacterized repeat protein (TIGR01451 family)